MQDGSVRAINPAERQTLLGPLQPANPTCQTLCGDSARVHLARGTPVTRGHEGAGWTAKSFLKRLDTT
ncbi:hypothetical protein ADL04_35570 [Streptomyces sp. NRRL B-3648]|nr:hypothetical protein ADL04_35570 [Streptomyces sp. NRRL B-3648]